MRTPSLARRWVIAQLGVTVGDQHQRHLETRGDLLQMSEILHPDQADAIGTGSLVGAGTADHLIHVQHAGVGAGDDRQIRINTCLSAARILPTPSRC
jgi:hypothetical protein